MGEALTQRLEELEPLRPVGMEISVIALQSESVTKSINGFMINLAEAVIIVLAVLWIAIGFRSAAIVGLCGLVFTIVGSFLFMKLSGVDLQRMSLGALVISMGMMVIIMSAWVRYMVDGDATHA